MLKELLSYIKTISKDTMECKKQEIERGILFWIIQGTLCISTLVLLEISLFSWLSGIFEVYVVAFITALASFVIFIIVHFLQKHCTKNVCRKADEQLQLLLYIIEAFIEGLKDRDSVKAAGHYQENTKNPNSLKE